MKQLSTPDPKENKLHDSMHLKFQKIQTNLNCQKTDLFLPGYWGGRERKGLQMGKRKSGE